MAKPEDRETKKCPQCGQTAMFRQRTAVPGSGAAFVGEGGALPEPIYSPAWKCENLDCDYYEQVDS